VLDRQDGFLDLFGLQPDGFADFGQRIAGLGAVEEPGAQALFQGGNAGGPTVAALVLRARDASLRLPDRATAKKCLKSSHSIVVVVLFMFEK
jgi:hypothetical protein